MLQAGQAGGARLKPNPSNPFNYGVVAEGRILPQTEIVRVAPYANGPAVVQKLWVKLNQTVEKGALLATLQSKPLCDAQVEQARAQVAQAESALARIKAQNEQLYTQFEAQTKQAAQLVDRSAAQLDAAKAQDEAQSAALARKLEQARKTLEALQGESQTLDAESAAAIAAAQATLEATRAAKETKILKAQLDQAAAAAQRARQAFDRQIASAQAEVAQLEADAALAKRADQTKEAQLALAQAKESLGLRDTEFSKLKNAAAQTEKEAAAALNTARATLAQALAQAALSEIRAPQAGTVLAIYAQPGESIGQQGLCELADTQNLVVEAQVYVDDIARVHLGATARATGAGINGTLAGKVVEISKQVIPNTAFKLDPSSFSDQRIVLVRIALDDPKKAAHVLNAQVTVSIDPEP